MNSTGTPAASAPENKTTDPSPKPKPVLYGERAQRIRATLDERSGRDYETMMNNQAQALDALFHQIVLENAGSALSEIAAFSIALRAQAQCRSIWQGFDISDYRREKTRRNRRADY